MKADATASMTLISIWPIIESSAGELLRERAIGWIGARRIDSRGSQTP
jgi:hypothetical protein